jgi:hypothetical protein
VARRTVTGGDQPRRKEPGGARAKIASECGNAESEAAVRLYNCFTATVRVYLHAADPAAGAEPDQRMRGLVGDGVDVACDLPERRAKYRDKRQHAEKQCDRRRQRELNLADPAHHGTQRRWMRRLPIPLTEVSPSGRARFQRAIVLCRPKKLCRHALFPTCHDSNLAWPV